MGGWPDKYVIGLTGNIGTGKTTVRRMLEDLGAFGIDADTLVHNALDSNGLAYDSVVQAFGGSILGHRRQIDRQKLARTVFNEPAQLAKLEAIIHPIVRRELDRLITQTSKPVVVVEAIKLIEGGLADECNAIWVVQASQEQCVSRVTSSRQMSSEQALQRLRAQTSQASKAAHADIIIQNDGRREEAREQVDQAWSDTG